jgi:nicotinamidase-related amidase
MTTNTYAAEGTGLLIVDAYNDFMSESGKFYERTIVLHHRWREGSYKGWKHMNPSQASVNQAQGFAAGTWGREFHPEFGQRDGDVVVHEHWGQSGFAKTDLDARLKQHGIQKIILVGFISNTCVESTARFGMELGYHVTLSKDATAAFSQEGMHAAHEVNRLSFAHAILAAAETVRPASVLICVV